MTATGNSSSDRGAGDKSHSRINEVYTFFVYLISYPVVTWPFVWAIQSETIFIRPYQITVFFLMDIFYTFVSLPLGFVFALYFGTQVGRNGWFGVKESVAVSFLVGLVLRVPDQIVPQGISIDLTPSVQAVGKYIWGGISYALVAMGALLLIRYFLIVVGLMPANDPQADKATP